MPKLGIGLGVVFIENSILLTTTSSVDNALLKEDSDFLLQENTDYILLE